MLRLIARAGWPAAAVVLLHGLLATLLGHPRGLDPAFHVLGGAAVAFGLHELVVRWRSDGAPASTRTALVAFVLACLLAALWEAGELASDLWLGTRAHRGAADTVADLVLGAMGALGIVVYRHHRRQRPTR